MTIERNAEQQPINWTSGSVGDGYLFNGNSGDTSRGYISSVDSWDVDKGSDRHPRASFILSNGSKIYDFSGNVWEHVMYNSSDNLLNNLPNDGGAAGFRWVELSALVNLGDFSS
jgi:formylglycine-generating enzyme required for sulfatase activity